MTALSSRYVPWLLVVVALALLVVARGGFAVRRVDDCAHPERLLEMKGLPRAGPASQDADRLNEDVTQWMVSKLADSGPGIDLRAALVRSFDPIALYTRPPGILLGQFEAGQREIEYVDVAGERLPIQTIFDSSDGRPTMASYLFVYGGRPVEHPALEQVKNVVSHIWSGTRPLTLMIVAGQASPSRRAVALEQGRDWIEAAYLHYRDACDS